MGTLTYSGTLTTLNCHCGIHFAIPSDLHRRAKNSSSVKFYCPMGHVCVYRDDENTRLKAQLDQAQADAQWQQRRGDRLLNDLEATRRSAAAVKGHLTRMRKRVANGVCPVPDCKRSFKQVERHIRSQHAGWLEEHPEVLDV